MLTYIGLWNFSDDYGTVKGNSVWLKNQIYPYKDKLRIDAFSTWLERLVELEVIIPFTYKGESFYYIRTFRKHQRVDKPSKARNCNESDLIEILKAKGFEYQQDGEFTKHSTSTHRVLQETSCKDKEEDIGKGRGDGCETTPPVMNSNALKSIDQLMAECLRDQINFVEYVRRDQKITEAQLVNALEAFNSRLKSGSEILKTPRDYRYHFQNWLRKQDKVQFRVNPQSNIPAQTVRQVLQNIGL
jgi:hypothetical protein